MGISIEIECNIVGKFKSKIVEADTEKKLTFLFFLFSLQPMKLMFTNISDLKRFQRANFMLALFEKDDIFVQFVPMFAFSNLLWSDTSSTNISNASMDQFIINKKFLEKY